jgi:hypothetical protein
MRGVDLEVRYVQEDAANVSKRELARWLVIPK